MIVAPTSTIVRPMMCHFPAPSMPLASIPTAWPNGNMPANMIVMFCGLLFLEKSTKLGVGIILTGAVWWVASLYNWLTTPLEDAH